jgi:hypothetical protein
MFNGIAIASVIIASIALLISCVSLCLFIGIKNSTHQVVWKEVEPKNEVDDLFEDAIEEQNPNKRVKREEPFYDPTDPTETANNW